MIIRRQRDGICISLTKEGNDRSRVVPDASVKTDGVMSQLVENLFHLERGQHVLDEDTALDGTCRQTIAYIE